MSWNGPFRRAYSWWQGDGSADTEVYDVHVADGVFYRVLFDRQQRAWRVLGWYD